MAHSTDNLVGSGKAWAEQVIEMYSEGCSDAEVAASLRVPLREYLKQINDNPAFGQLVEFGRTLSQGFWEGLARKNVGNKSFNSPLYAFYMKNRHGWADKVETTSIDDTASTDLDTLRQQVVKDVADFIKLQTPELTDAQRILKAVNE